MIHKVLVDLQKDGIIELELDDKLAPKTVRFILESLPISTVIHVWGEELYTDPVSIVTSSENPKQIVNLMDVAYWPPGKALCLFFGSTPIGKKGEITPYSPVNVVGKIIRGNFPRDVVDGSKVIFKLS